MPSPIRRTVRAKAALTATDQSSAVDVWGFALNRFVAILDSDAGTGTSPTLDVKLQTSPDSGTTWADLPSATFTQVTGAGASVQALVVENVGTHVRAVFTVGGSTPSFDVGLTFVGVS